jgi:hypothetical protein
MNVSSARSLVLCLGRGELRPPAQDYPSRPRVREPAVVTALVYALAGLARIYLGFHFHVGMTATTDWLPPSAPQS